VSLTGNMRGIPINESATYVNNATYFMFLNDLVGASENEVDPEGDVIDPEVN
jgi:hypothetical protein